MSDINANLDENNPAHKIVIELNKKNQEIYGEYHDECSLYDAFCHCVPSEIKFNELSASNKKIYSDIENLIIYWVNDGTKTAGTLTRRIMYMLDKKNLL